MVLWHFSTLHNNLNSNIQCIHEISPINVPGKESNVRLSYRVQGFNQLLRLVFVILPFLTFPSVLNLLVSIFQWKKKEHLCPTTDDLHGNYHLISISDCRFLQPLQRSGQGGVQV